MQLRRGKTKTFIESAINCAMLAVEIYNKPRAPFRVEGFITHMIMAWTRLLHAYFNHEIGDKFYYKDKGKFKIVDGERKAWELKTCINKYGKLSEPVKINLDFFIRLRNKIEHRTIDKDEIGLMIFGECQSLLYNFENELVKLFGIEYALNESLAYSLQFSTVRTTGQMKSSKQLLSNELKEVKHFIEKYRTSLDDEVFTSQEFSIKLIQIPKIANTNRNDLAVEFVNWNSLSETDKKNFDKVSALVKDKVVKIEVINPGRLKPNKVVIEVNKSIDIKINPNDHKCILSIFGIRPYKGFIGGRNPFETNTKYCHFDEAHGDYLYNDSWIKFLIKNINSKTLTRDMWRAQFESKEKIDISKFEIHD